MKILLTILISGLFALGSNLLSPAVSLIPNAISMVTTGRSVGDNIASSTFGENCKTLNILEGKDYCIPYQHDVSVHQYRTFDPEIGAYVTVTEEVTIRELPDVEAVMDYPDSDRK